MTKAIELSQLGSNLDVGTEIELSLPLRTNNGTYASNVDVPYLIAGTSNYTGATTNWGTFGFQHRFKSNSGGTARITIDGASGEFFCVDNAGRVGIGMVAPNALLDVRKNISTAYDPTDDSAQRSGTATISVRNDDGTTNSFAQLTFDTAGTNQSIARIVAIRSGTSSNHLAFVTEHGNTKAEKLRITSSGDVGIGTATPAGTLHLADAACSIYLQETDASADNGIWAYSANSEELTWQARNDALSGGGNLFKMTRTGNSIDAFKGLKAGNTWLIADNTTRRVGIGTESPQYELDVSSTKDAGSVVARIGNNSDTGNLQAILQLRVGTTTVKYVNLNTNYSASYFHIGGTNITTAYYSFNSHIFRDNAGTEKFRINSSTGNVGIGTNNPNRTLHVQGNFSLSGSAHIGAVSQSTNNLRDSQTTVNRIHKVQINSESGPGSSLGLISWHSATPGYYSPQLWLAKSNSSDDTVGTNTLVTNGTDLGAINFAGNDGATFLNAASIRAEVDGTAATNDMPGRLVFFTNGGAVNPTERMRIDSNGSVGIGTALPQQKLDVKGNLLIRPSDGDVNGTDVELRFGMTDAHNQNKTAIIAEPQSSWGRHHLHFCLDTVQDLNNVELSDSKMVINNNGNVGIGTNSPDAKLDVNGKVAIQRPSNYWQNNTQVFFDDGTNPIGSIGHHGGFAIALTSNGYRNNSGQWTSHSASTNNFTGAAQVEVQPQGNIYFRTDSNKATGTSTNPTTRIHIDSLGRMRIGGVTPLYALDVRGESMSGLEYKAISSENGVLARESAGFGQASDNSAGCGLECILFQNNINNNWVAFDLMIHASSCATTGASHASAWFFYRCRVYAQSGFSFTQVDSGGDTGSVTISINDDGNVGTAIGLGSDADARQFEVRMSVSGGQRSTLSVFVNSYPKIARFRRQP